MTEWKSENWRCWAIKVKHIPRDALALLKGINLDFSDYRCHIGFQFGMASKANKKIYIKLKPHDHANSVILSKY